MRRTLGLIEPGSGRMETTLGLMKPVSGRMGTTSGLVEPGFRRIVTTFGLMRPVPGRTGTTSGLIEPGFRRMETRRDVIEATLDQPEKGFRSIEGRFDSNQEDRPLDGREVRSHQARRSSFRIRAQSNRAAPRLNRPGFATGAFASARAESAGRSGALGVRSLGGRCRRRETRSPSHARGPRRDEVGRRRSQVGFAPLRAATCPGAWRRPPRAAPARRGAAGFRRSIAPSCADGPKGLLNLAGPAFFGLADQDEREHQRRAVLA